jgi:F-type H+-transporting ATPase subunit b
MFASLSTPILAATEAAGKSSGDFLVKPGIGLMVFTLVVFGISMLLLWKLAFPQISEALAKRQRVIEDSIDSAQRTKDEAAEILAEYRERLKEARVQAEEIVTRARKSAETHERESLEQAKITREELLEQTRRDVEAETRRAIQEIRREVADLTVAATEAVTRKTLDGDDQRRLVEEALAELDFTALGERR